MKLPRPSTPPAAVVRSTIRHDDGNVVVVLGGEIDLATLSQLAAAVDQALAPTPTGVFIDASGVTFIDSTGVSTLVSAHLRCKDLGVGLTVLPSPVMQRVFTATALDTLFTTPAPPADAAHQTDQTHQADQTDQTGQTDQTHRADQTDQTGQASQDA